MALVGDTFGYALGRRPSIQLWATDGNHAMLAGAYLGAAVLSSEIRYAYSHDTRMPNPEASTYTAGLPRPEAAWLRSTAGEFVRAAALNRGPAQ
ncbi:MAG TPA: hypothetical protein VGI87_00425 [Solirubrobacteraceae bacterium]